MKQKKLFIIGPAHSGTSLVAKIVNDKFVELPGPLQFNHTSPQIGYENTEFNIFNAELLNVCGTPCPIRKIINYRYIQSPAYIDSTKINGVVTIPDVIKAPYLCFTLGIFKKIFDCYVIIVNRNPDDTISSLEKREELQRYEAMSLYDAFIKHLDYNIEGCNFINVSFEKLLENDEDEINKMGEFIKKWQK